MASIDTGCFEFYSLRFIEDTKFHVVAVLLQANKPAPGSDIRSGRGTIGVCIELPAVAAPRNPGSSRRAVGKRNQAIPAGLNVDHFLQAGNLPAVTGV